MRTMFGRPGVFEVAASIVLPRKASTDVERATVALSRTRQSCCFRFMEILFCSVICPLGVCFFDIGLEFLVCLMQSGSDLGILLGKIVVFERVCGEIVGLIKGHATRAILREPCFPDFGSIEGVVLLLVSTNISISVEKDMNLVVRSCCWD